MDSKQIEIEGMKELLKENELEIGRLRKEIKNLKEERDMHRDAAKDCGYDIKELKEENKKLNVIIDNNDLEQKADWEHIEELEEENKRLKEDLAFKSTMLDNVRAEYESSQNVIKKMKAELEWYKKQYNHTMGEN